MAVTGFKGFGYLLCFATVSPACYMVSSQVAAERGRVEAVDRAILQAKMDIRRLETEFDTRANHDQLERWNGDVLALSAPRPEQYLASDTGLAALRPTQAGATNVAALVVPTGVTTPTVVAAVVPAGAEPAQTRAVVTPAVATPVVTRAAMPMQTAASPAARGRMKVAMLDAGLLSESTLGDLASRARAERVALR
ncbi:hypothetical protein [Sphingomonas sp. RS2018]